MSDFRLVSVVIPAYNAAQNIVETLESAINQTYTNIEIVCVDDGSTDDTLQIVDDFRERLDRDISFKVVPLKENSKTAAARNAGIREASGDYILPLDADDCIDAKYIAKAVKIFASNPTIGVVYCKARQFGDINEDWYLPPFCPVRIVKRNMVHSTSMFRRSDWVRYQGYDEKLIHGLEDWDFWLKFVEDNRFFYQIPEYLLARRVQGKSRSSIMDDSQLLKESLQRLRKSHRGLVWKRKLKRFSFAKLRRKIQRYTTGAVK